MAVRLLALRAGHPLPPGRFPVHISVRGRVDPSAIVRLEGLDQLKSPVTSSGLEPPTFRLVALVHAHAHTHTHTHIYVCMYVYIYISKI
jgi:hypothetical protein